MNGDGQAGQSVPVMSIDDAFKTIAQVCAAFQGNLQQHQQIQEALRIVSAELSPEAKKAAPAKSAS